MKTVEPFKEAKNGVVLKTSQKVCFDDIFLAVNVAASLGDICGKLQPTFRTKKKLSCSCCPHVEQNMASKKEGGAA